jgi:Fe-S-cluster containining protein
MNSDASDRLHFPDDEEKQHWLADLLLAYAVCDQGVAEGIRRAEKQGKTLACKKGCAACCRSHTTIPVYPIELLGMSWYATEKIQGEKRETLKQQLRDYKQREGCPFLVDEACSIHALRPMACRQFNVFDKVCKEGEDAYYTRRKDVLAPIKKFTEQAFEVTLPFYGVTSKTEKRQVLKNGSIHQLARIMLENNWDTLAGKVTTRNRPSNRGRIYIVVSEVSRRCWCRPLKPPVIRAAQIMRETQEPSIQLTAFRVVISLYIDHTQPLDR